MRDDLNLGKGGQVSPAVGDQFNNGCNGFIYSACAMQKVIDRALQVHGGLGMTDDTIISFFYRHERAARIYDGADEVHKVSVARRILREYEGKAVK